MNTVDNQRIYLGAGNDLQIYHNAGQSYIDASASGNTSPLSIRAYGNAKIDVNGGSETAINAISNGAVELYYDNSKKLETTSTGSKTTGMHLISGESDIDNQFTPLLYLQSTANTNIKAVFLLEDDYTTGRAALAINVGESGVTNDRDLMLQKAGGRVGIRCSPTEAFEISGTSKFNGAIKLGDNNNLKFGAGEDLLIYHDSSGNDSFIKEAGTGRLQIWTSSLHIKNQAGDEVNLVTNEDGNCELWFDNSKKFETTSAGGTITGALTTNNGGGNAVLGSHLDLGDNQKVRCGSSDDLQIYHDGSTNIIDGQFHPIEIRHQSEVHIKCVDDGSVELYHNNSKRISTTTTGASITRQNSGEYFNVNANYGSSGDQAIETSGDLTFYTNGSSIAARLDQDGLKFNGDTAAANGLDDYEEGTFTPALEFTGTTNISYSGSSRNAEYVKVGNLVYIRLFVNGTSSGTNTGQLKVTGLPFTPNSGGYGRHACSVQAGGLSISSGEAGAFGLIEESEAKIDVYAGSTAGVNVTISAAKWNNSGFYIAGTYHILGY